MESSEILLTIVMPSFNQAAYLERALLSVIRQKVEDIELIVVDGGSTDGSLAIIERYDSQIDYWVSEPDRGQSHAFNKGFQRARGRYLTWVNSDDILLPGSVDAFRRFVNQRDFPEWVAANSLWIDSNDLIIRGTFNSGWSEFAARHGALSVTGPASYFTKALLEEAGLIDETYHYSMDTELWYRFFRLGRRFEVFDHFTWALRLHENAKTSGKDFSGDDKVIASIANETRRTFEKYDLQSPGLSQRIALKVIRLGRAAKLRSIIYTMLHRGSLISKNDEN